MSTPTISSGSHGKRAMRTFAAAVRLSGLVVLTMTLPAVTGAHLNQIGR